MDHAQRRDLDQWIIRIMDQAKRPPRTWVCDGCMATVTAQQIKVWADYEHVLCRRCWRRETTYQNQGQAP